MKITLNKSNFELILNNFQTFLDKKDSSQITSHIYLETLENNQLLLKATDYEIGLESKISILKNNEDGIATVNGRKILEIIKWLKDDEITIESNEETMLIKQGKSKFKLATFNAAEFNSSTKFPQISEKDVKINLNPSYFLNSIKKVIPAADTNNTKVELTGALIDIKDYECNFVATDTRRLAITRQDTQSLGSQFQIIIPKKAITEILKLFVDDFEIFYSDTLLFIKSANYTFFTKRINGRYPEYEKIIPKEFKHNFNLPKASVIDAIRLINSISINVKITLDSNGLLFEAMSAEEVESASTPVELKLKIDEPLVLGINSKYMLDFLSQTDSSEFGIFINEPNTPFLLKDNYFSTIIMPVIF